jgi:hypothetical protein
VEWEEFLPLVEDRLALFVGMPRYERAFSAMTGFDLAHGREDLVAFQRWMSARHPHDNRAYWALVLVEEFGAGMTEEGLTGDAVHRRAIAALCRLFREFRNAVRS